MAFEEVESSFKLLAELDQLKSVYRKAYISDASRNENSAEHSWHLSTALMVLEPMLPKPFNMDRAIRMALLHDVCEIGAGDVSVYAPERVDQSIAEENYLIDLAARFPDFGEECLAIWKEYESQDSLEAQWVRIIDKLLPFILNVLTEGRCWRDQNINRAMVEKHNEFIKDLAPRLYQWMLYKIDLAVDKGWLHE